MEIKNQKFRKLRVWSKSMDFIQEIYKITKQFPSNEQYGLTIQLRRSATSIALNIAEGSGGREPEFNRYLSISLRSAYEVMCALEVAKMLNYCSQSDKESLLSQCNNLSAMIGALKRRLLHKQGTKSQKITNCQPTADS